MMCEARDANIPCMGRATVRIVLTVKNTRAATRCLQHAVLIRRVDPRPAYVTFADTDTERSWNKLAEMCAVK